MDIDHAAAVIRSRCGDALTEIELDQIEAAVRQQPAPVLLDGEAAARLIAALDQLETRVGQIIASANATHEAGVAAGQVREAWDAFVDAADINTTWN